MKLLRHNHFTKMTRNILMLIAEERFADSAAAVILIMIAALRLSTMYTADRLQGQ